MAELEHLVLKQVGEPTERRPKGGFGRPPQRIRSTHSQKLQEKAKSLVDNYSATLPPDIVDPSLILKVKLAPANIVADQEWERANLKVLSTSTDGTVVLFSNENELQTFRQRLDAYAGGPVDDKKHPPHYGVFDRIDTIETISPEDRIGSKLKRAGLSNEKDFDNDDEITLDVEIWRPSIDFVDVAIQKIIDFIKDNDGEYINEYRAPTGLLLRAKATKKTFGKLLSYPDVAGIDYPPTIDLEETGPPSPNVTELPPISPPPTNAPCIGIIDSGVNSAHPIMENVVVGAFGESNLPADDDKGHGTAVASILSYGDLRTQLQAPQMQARFKVASARVVDANGEFPDIELAPKLIENAIIKLNADYNCRIINISLNDPNQPVTEKGSMWSETLDRLARELDIVIVISAGNSSNLTSTYGANLPAVYPEYLYDGTNQILEPAGAVNSLTVGSIAHLNGLDKNDAEQVEIRPIASANQPSPFTRQGPGLNQAIKPDLVDYGGNAVFDGATQQIRDGKSKPSAGILTAHHKYTDRLFSTASGTSFSAPILAWKAAVLLEKYPDFPANFYRSLLSLTANIPEQSTELLIAKDKPLNEQMKLLGYGHSNVLHALSSDDDRVILYANANVEVNKFHIYEIPIPDKYQSIKGTRTIDVSLAFMPPVRRTRKDYLGIGMEFNLIRGCSQKEVFDAFKKLAKEESSEELKLPKKSCNCDLLPKVTIRSKGSLQRAQFTMQQNIKRYGDTYYLVVRSVGKWAKDDVDRMPFSLSVMLTHEAQVSLYSKIKARLALRT